jgi:hypothetical protein
VGHGSEEISEEVGQEISEEIGTQANGGQAGCAE